MIAAHFGSRLRFRHPRVGVADDRQMIAKRLERAQGALADVELPAGRGGTPEILGQTVLAAARRAVDLLDADEARAACRPRGSRLREHGSCGNHRVEKWQRDGGADTTQHGATRQVLSGSETSMSPCCVAWPPSWSRTAIVTFCSLSPSFLPAPSETPRFSPRRESGPTCDSPRLGVPHDLADRRHVVILDAAAERVRQQPLGQVRHDHVGLRHQRRAQVGRRR